MSYKWSNKKKLDSLSVSGRDSVLYLSTENEEVEIYIKDNDINTVVHRSNGIENTITNSQSHHIVVGEENTRRDVYHYLKPNGPAKEFRVGITKHSSKGSWSSLPHEFELNLESGFEEVFFYLIEGQKKRAIQVGEGVWCDNSAVSACWFVYDRSFSTIPMGYHPVAAEPGTQVSYIWAYLCKKTSWEKI